MRRKMKWLIVVVRVRLPLVAVRAMLLAAVLVAAALANPQAVAALLGRALFGLF